MNHFQNRNWPQTIEVTNEWNQAVKDTIEKNYELLEMATFLDVFQASLSIPQLTNDHIHKTGKVFVPPQCLSSYAGITVKL